MTARYIYDSYGAKSEIKQDSQAVAVDWRGNDLYVGEPILSYTDFLSKETIYVLYEDLYAFLKSRQREELCGIVEAINVKELIKVAFDKTYVSFHF